MSDTLLVLLVLLVLLLVPLLLVLPASAKERSSHASLCLAIQEKAPHAFALPLIWCFC